MSTRSVEAPSAGFAEQQPCDGCKTSNTTSDVDMVGLHKMKMVAVKRKTQEEREV
jgi:hypothetical protein